MGREAYMSIRRYRRTNQSSGRKHGLTQSVKHRGRTVSVAATRSIFEGQVVKQEGRIVFDQRAQETAPCQQFTLIHVSRPLWARGLKPQHLR